MKRWIAVGIWGASAALALSGTTRASAQTIDGGGGVEDAATVRDGATIQLGGMDAAVVVVEAGASDAGGSRDGGATDGGDGGKALPNYDLLERDDGGRACSAAGPGGISNGLSLALTLGLGTVVVRRRKRG
jgi:hypothetical protein